MTRPLDTAIPEAPAPRPGFLIRLHRHVVETDHDPYVQWSAAVVGPAPEHSIRFALAPAPGRSASEITREAAIASLDHNVKAFEGVGGWDMEIVPGYTETRTPFPEHW